MVTLAVSVGQWFRRAIERALTRLRAGEADLRRFQEALAAGRESATLAPIWWRVRGALAQYLDAADHIGHALRNTRVLVGRSIRVIAEMNRSLVDSRSRSRCWGRRWAGCAGSWPTRSSRRRAGAGR